MVITPTGLPADSAFRTTVCRAGSPFEGDARTVWVGFMRLYRHCAATRQIGDRAICPPGRRRCGAGCFERHRACGDHRQCQAKKTEGRGGGPLVIATTGYSLTDRRLDSVVSSANAARTTMLNSANREVPKYHADTFAVMGKLARIV